MFNLSDEQIASLQKAVNSDVPIIALSSDPDGRKCREAGMTDFYQKPILDEQFQDIFSKWLKPEWSAV